MAVFFGVQLLEIRVVYRMVREMDFDSSFIGFLTSKNVRRSFILLTNDGWLVQKVVGSNLRGWLSIAQMMGKRR